MHPAAEYVHRDKDGRAWSTFEDFQELIALLYLAAIDEQAPPIDDFTIETRVEHFLIELALIGRAHNWDATDREEEYDDLGADQPSCSIGVKKRLLQSVKGHPLLDMLSESIIDIEVRRIVKDHFTSHINDENCEALHQEWVAICEEGRVSASSSHLFSLNFTPSERDQHIASILEKYGPRLDQALQSYLHRRFQIEEPFNNLAEKFGGEINLTAMLEEKRKTHSQAQHLEQASSIVGGSFFKQADAPKYDDAIQIYPSKRSRNE
ncbi:MAG: hypothetical protein EBY16_08995 [Gammaproteobacteria bacterium]|nr:hypothetical protein [Gammaproteobacteria bacterium]